MMFVKLYDPLRETISFLQRIFISSTSTVSSTQRSAAQRCQGGREGGE